MTDEQLLKANQQLLKNAKKHIDDIHAYEKQIEKLKERVEYLVNNSWNGKGTLTELKEKVEKIVFDCWKDNIANECPKCGKSHQEHEHRDGYTLCDDDTVASDKYPYNQCRVVLFSEVIELLKDAMKK